MNGGYLLQKTGKSRKCVIIIGILACGLEGLWWD